MADKLHYAGAEHQPKRQVTRKRAIVLVVAGAIAVIVAWLPSTIHNVKVMNLQRKCLDYSPAPTTVVFDTRSDSLPGLTRSDPDLRSIQLPQGPALGRVPAAWPDFRRAAGFTGPAALATLYLHGMETPSGNRRLVAISISPQIGARGGLELWSHVLELGDLQSAPKETVRGPVLTLTPRGDDVFIRAGQPDTKRADRFTIDAVVGGTVWVIDGYLRDDFTVTMDVIPRTLTPLPPSSPASSR